MVVTVVVKVSQHEIDLGRQHIIHAADKAIKQVPISRIVPSRAMAWDMSELVVCLLRSHQHTKNVLSLSEEYDHSESLHSTGAIRLHSLTLHSSLFFSLPPTVKKNSPQC